MSGQQHRGYAGRQQQRQQQSSPDASQNQAFDHQLNAFAPWFRRQFEYVNSVVSPYLSEEESRNQQQRSVQQQQRGFQRGYTFESDNNSEESMPSDESVPPPPPSSPPPAMFQPPSPPARSSPSRNRQQSTKTRSQEKGGLMSCYKNNPTHRMNLWTILALFILGPPVFLAGYFLGHGIDVIETSARAQPSKATNEGSSTGTDTSTLTNNVFLDKDTMIHMDESIFLTANEKGIHLLQKTNGNLVLVDEDETEIWTSDISAHTAIWKSDASITFYSKLQSDGNLVTRSRSITSSGGASSRVIWSTESGTMEGGDYSLQLSPQKDGLQIVRGIDGVIVWKSNNDSDNDNQNDVTPAPVPFSVPNPTDTSPVVTPTAPSPWPTRTPREYPTRDPTPQPTKPPTRSPTPFPTPPPSPKPTVFPRPPTVEWSSTDSMDSGPMVGHTTHSSSKLWAFQGSGKTMQLVVWAYGDSPDADSISLDMPPNQDNGGTMVTVENLSPSTLYLYEIRMQNKRVGEGHFKTAPEPDKPTQFKYVLASCMNVWSSSRGYRDQPVWSVTRGKEPDFALLPGDTVYLNGQDWTDEGEILFDRFWYRTLEQRAESHFADLVRTVPTYGAWDDHDYGKSNVGHKQLGKENSLRAWKSLWPSPSHGLPTVPGNFYSYIWGDVHFIVMDNRYHRGLPSGSQFGDAQKEWLYQELINSKSTFKIIVTGSDTMETGWSGDLKGIGDVITEHKISGVLFNAGDIHRNEFKSQYKETWPYRVTQFTSSGVAREWRRNFAIVSVDTSVADPTITASFYGAVDAELDTTWHNDPNQQCNDIEGTNRNKESSCTQTIRLSQLTA